jgi:L-alanine-DL-glutamate epimerase-like enolase superfamily enzyme
MNLSFTEATLRFKRPFSIAHGSRHSTPVVFTKLEHNDFIGFGEASMPPYLKESHESVLRFLEKAKQLLLKFSNPLEIENILAEVDALDEENTAAKASIDIALHDLIGKILNQPCHKLFGVDKNKSLFTAYTIPIDKGKGIKERIQEAKDYWFLKIKLGSPNDKKLIEEIRKYTDKEFFVDVNEGWTDKYFALDMLHWLAEKKCLFAEQPLPKEMREEISWLTEKSPIPIIADEAIKRLSDIKNVKGIYHGINIKLMKCTGFNEARKMITLARKYGLKVLLGCMSESSCAVSAASQIASFADWIDLDGPLLIKEDFFQGVTFEKGRIILNELPGIGVLPLKDIFN